MRHCLTRLSTERYFTDWELDAYTRSDPSFTSHISVVFLCMMKGGTALCMLQAPQLSSHRKGAPDKEPLLNGIFNAYPAFMTSCEKKSLVCNNIFSKPE